MPTQIKHSNRTKYDLIFRWTSVLLTIIGLADSLYLLIYKYSSNDKMCLGSGDCATVNYSEYSEIYGIPVALLGMLAYLAILLVLVLEPRWKLAEEKGPLAVFGISLVGALFSAYLTYIEFFIIYAVCPFCVISGIVMTFLFILAIIRLIRHIT